MVKINAAVVCDIGNIRRNNEDNFYLNGIYMPREKMDAGCAAQLRSDDDVQLYAVFDGMGGEADGELASLTAASLMGNLQQSLADGHDRCECVDAFVYHANEAIVQSGKGAGTTMAMVCVRGGVATVVHMGDSRVYFIRGGKVKFVTDDHTGARRLFNMGLIRESELAAHPQRNALTRYLGICSEQFAVVPQYENGERLRKGDGLLICSDGVGDVVTEAEILSACRLDVMRACRSLVEAALSAGSRDNVTAMLIKVK